MATFTNLDGTPANLTAEQQAEALTLANQTPDAAPERRMTDPYKPVLFKDDAGNPIPLTAQQQTEARQKAGMVDPMLDLPPADMFKLARETKDLPPEKQFNIYNAFLARKDELTKDPAAVQRVADAWELYRDSTNLGDLPTPTEALANAWNMVKGTVKQAGSFWWNAADA